MPCDLSIILPAYNEAACIREVVEELLALLPSLGVSAEVVVVDDGSTDETGTLLREMAEAHEAVRVVTLDGNHGQSAAFLAGFRAARGETLVTMDADGQNDPSSIPDLLAALEGSDCVVGYRVDRQDTRSKRWGSRLANAVRGRVLGDGIIDTGCALKVFRRKWAEGLPSWNGIHRFFPAFFLMQGARITQVPVKHRPRIAGTSKYTNLGRLRRTIRDLFGVRWLKSRYLVIRIRK